MKKPETIDDYLSTLPIEVKAVLEQVRSTIAKAEPRCS